jgi:hypothetical protein
MAVIAGNDDRIATRIDAGEIGKLTELNSR